MPHVLTLAAANREALGAAGTALAGTPFTPTRIETLRPDLVEDWHFDGALLPDRLELKTLLDPLPVDFAFQPLAGRKKQLLLADMDSTIISCECLDELADFAGKKTEIAAITERAMRGEMDFEAALRTRVRLLAGLDEAALAACFEQRVRLNPGARTLVATMARFRARCVLISGGFSYFTQRVQQLAGFHAEFSNSLLVASGRLTGEIGLPLIGKEAKAACLARECALLGIPPGLAMAIGDGANDADMIASAGLGVAYRGKPLLRALAPARIQHTDLSTALYFQGYPRESHIDAE